MKTPEEYFLERDFRIEGEAEHTPAEQAFLQKYMGIGEEAQGPRVEVPRPAVVESAPGFGPPPAAAAESTAPAVSRAASPTPPAAAPGAAPGAAPKAAAEIPQEPDILEELRKADSLQLVAFYVNDQEFTVPIMVVQEVIRFVPPTKLPTAPPFVTGVVNLRGRITPLVRLSDLVGGGAGQEPRFIVVCRRKGLQLGLIIQSVKTMYRVEQKQIDWSVETHLGAGVEFVAGLLKSGEEKLIGILSIDRIVDKILKG